jgi:hypothetical protein
MWLMLPFVLIAALASMEPPAQGSAGDPQPPATATDPSTPGETAPAAPRRVWVVLDFYKEFGGTVVREDAESVVLRTRDGSERTLDRNSVVNAIPLLDDPEGTAVLVNFRDGRQVKAELVEDTFDAATVRIAGVRTVIPRSEVWGLSLQVPFERQLQVLRQAIPPTAWAQRIELARWAMREGHPEVALEELREIAKHQDSDEVRKLLRLAEIDVRTQRARRTGAQDVEVPRRARPRPDQAELPRLSEDQVNMIRVLEVDMRQPPRMQSLPTLPRRIMQAYGESGRLPAGAANLSQLESMGPAQLLALLFDLKARDLYGEIRVMEDPEHLSLFRRKVHDAWLIPNCATSRCHGGDQAGNFRLIRDEPRDARTAYSNLLLLLSHRRPNGDALLNFDDPAASGLLELGRPASQARHPHPQVPGWRPTVVDPRGELQSTAVAWIRGMHRPRPEYPFTLELPSPPAAGTSAGER